MVGDTILIKDISINGNDELKNSSDLSKKLTDNTINALGIDASSRTIWVNGQPYGNAYVNIKDDNTVEAPIGAEIFNDFANNVASGEYSHAEGSETSAIGDYSHAEGKNTKAEGDYSHAIGLYTKTTNTAEAAFGQYNKSIEGETIFSIGDGNSDGNRHNIVEVTNNEVNINTNLNVEDNLNVDGNTAITGNLEVTGNIVGKNELHISGETSLENKVAAGEGTTVTNDSEIAVGRFNISNKKSEIYGNENNTAFSIGIGTDEGNRKNALEIMQNGDVYINGIGGYDGVELNGSYDIATYLPNMVNIEYLQLKNLRDAGNLVPGQQYRITDYTTKTTQAGTTSAENVFDIIVIADDEGTINDVARAINHPVAEGETDYFVNSDLNAWQIWYCLDNDTTRFAWADTDDGRGVIYRMIDEFGNDCPYDFKNIQFYRKWDSSKFLWSTISSASEQGSKACYTFSSEGDSDTASFTDKSLISSSNVYSNVIKEYISLYKQTLNNICFFDGNIHNNIIENDCYDNTFGDDCKYNTFGSNCNNNIFGNGCNNNTLGNECSNNIFGNVCYNNIFGISCKNNIFGGECNNNIFSNDCDSNLFSGDCSSNTFGNGCDNNIFGDGCGENVFGNSCSHNTFGNYCSYNTFGNGCYNIKFASNDDDSTSTKYNYYQNNHLGDGCQYILFKGEETANDSAQVQKYKFAQGLQGTSSAYLTVDGIRNRSFETYISRDTNGVIKESVIADLTNMVEISYGNLVALRDSSKLVPGQQYRITDYTCTTTQQYTRSAEHAFDIIVTADSESALNEVARAIKHKGDTYFTNVDANLNAWQIWYCLDNDTARFEWADTTNGKGVIYRMIDEFNNDIPYDFKNIQFKHPNDAHNYPYYYYTFASDNIEGNTDNSLSISNKVYSNKILPFISGSKQSINRILFIGSECYGNTFGNDCYNNTFGSGCQYNTFGNVCYTNTFGNDCTKNTFGHRCYKIILGNSCNNNIIGTEGFDITLGDDCNNNTFGNKCSAIKFTNGIDDNAAKYDYYQYNHFGDGCNQILFQPDGTTSVTAQVQNYNFAEGLTPFSGMLIIKGKIGKEYDTTVSMDEDNTPHQFCLAQLFKQLGVLPITQS